MSPSARLPLGGTVALRKLRLITHAQAKQLILKIFRCFGSQRISVRCVEELRRHVRPELKALINRDNVTVLATAAPLIYAKPLALSLGMDAVVATETGGKEVRGEEKVARLRTDGKISFGAGCEVFTDHRDDLPLLRANAGGRNVLVCPDRETLEAAKAAGIDFEVM